MMMRVVVVVVVVVVMVVVVVVVVRQGVRGTVVGNAAPGLVQWVRYTHTHPRASTHARTHTTFTTTTTIFVVVIRVVLLSARTNKLTGTQTKGGVGERRQS